MSWFFLPSTYLFTLLFSIVSFTFPFYFSILLFLFCFLILYFIFNLFIFLAWLFLGFFNLNVLVRLSCIFNLFPIRFCNTIENSSQLHYILLSIDFIIIAFELVPHPQMCHVVMIFRKLTMRVKWYGRIAK